MKQKRIVFLCTSGSGGTWPPVIAIMKSLEEQGHRPLLIAERKLCEKTGTPDFHPIEPEQEFTLYYDAWIMKAMRQEVDASIPGFLSEWANAVVGDITPIVREFDPDMIISCLSCIDLAWQLSISLKVKWAMVNPGCYFDGENLQRLREDFHSYVATGIANYYPAKLRSASLVLHATDNRFDPQPENLPENNVCCGPLLWENDRDLPTYLDEPGDPWVLYSGSTAAGESDSEVLQDLISIIADFPLRLIITHSDAEELRYLARPGRIYLENSLPHSKLMPRCRLYIGPAGHGTVLKCLQSGLPMVLLIAGADQKGICRRAAATGAATVISPAEYSRSQLGDAIDLVLKDESYYRNAKHFSAYLTAQHANAAHKASSAVLHTIDTAR